MEPVVLSPLGHTWVLDLDGTIVKHNGYKLDGHDTLLDGAEAFLNRIPADDLVLIVTSRKAKYRAATLAFLERHGIRYDHIIFGAPFGERILVNDRKPSGLNTAVAINTERDGAVNLTIKVDEGL